ncbi:MAG: hypothetical protein Ct9H300mP1_15800 [Planctomycetaceae bacterium]|nr:MAG: hypothetical protein Ct9H300mP1_15800 [Planctomycetaceae bacterium]
MTNCRGTTSLTGWSGRSFNVCELRLRRCRREVSPACVHRHLWPLPNPKEAQSFLDDSRPDNRKRLVNTLLDHENMQSTGPNKWADLLRPNPYRVGIKGPSELRRWVRRAFRQNMPYDQFVRKLVAARAALPQWAVTLFRDRRNPAERTTIVTQFFPGHPFDVPGATTTRSRSGHRRTSTVSPPILPDLGTRAPVCPLRFLAPKKFSTALLGQFADASPHRCDPVSEAAFRCRTGSGWGNRSRESLAAGSLRSRIRFSPR